MFYFIPIVSCVWFLNYWKGLRVWLISLIKQHVEVDNKSPKTLSTSSFAFLTEKKSARLLLALSMSIQKH